MKRVRKASRGLEFVIQVQMDPVYDNYRFTDCWITLIQLQHDK